ncbi:TlpA family protein disulfide reductase [Nitratifractor sp.]
MNGHPYIIPAILLSLLLGLAGCSDKKEARYQEANATPSSPEPMTVHASKETSEIPQPKSFTIQDVDGRQTILEFTDHEAHFHRIRQPLVMLVLFADWCPPCRGMLPYLGKLQAANKDQLFVIGLLVHSELDSTGLRRLMRRYESNFFISRAPDNDALADYLADLAKQGSDYPLPLTLIFKNGKYIMNIQGAVPYEMLQSLIDQLRDIKKKEG